MISVIIPLYNKQHVILSTLDSVLNQSYTDYEVIIIDDGSTDNSPNLIRNIKNRHIHFVQKNNGGVSSARNYGLKIAKGEWILFLDADDYLLEDALSAFVKAIKKHPSFKVFSGGCIGEYFSKSMNYDKIYYNALRAYNRKKFIIRTGNTLFHKSCFEEIGCFNESLSLYEDLELFVKIMMNYPVVKLSKDIFAYETAFCFLSSKRGGTSSDFLTKLKFTKDKEYNNFLINFIGSRLLISNYQNDKDVQNYIYQTFPDYKKYLHTANQTLKKVKIQYILYKFIVLKQIIWNISNGHFENSWNQILSRCSCRFAKWGKNTCFGKRPNIQNCSKIFIYNNVRIGNHFKVYNDIGRLVIRDNTRIGNHVTIYTNNKETNQHGVIIGRNVIIEDYTIIKPGTYISDGSYIKNED